VPVYNSHDCLTELTRCIDVVLSGHSYSYQLILVNDCSTDDSWNTICQLSENYSSVVGISLRTNAGQDCALIAGLKHSSGSIIIILDDDLQHNPDNIPELIEKINMGYDVCYGAYDDKKQAVWKNLGSWFNGKLAEYLLKKPKSIYLSPYKAIRKEVVTEICKYNGPYPYIDGILLTVTSNISQIKVNHAPRYAGKSNYDLVKSVRVWLRLFTNYSVLPLRISMIVGVFSAFVGFALGVLFITWKIIYGIDVEGWTSLMVVMLFLGGIQLICLGLIGEYVGRMYLTVNNRLQFSIKETTKNLTLNN
jgi:glycosyltransferase involved in cell wall biosynthesis